MITFYKEYMIQYNERPVQDSYSKQNERPKQIVVTSIVANGNFHCMYGERIYDSLHGSMSTTKMLMAMRCFSVLN